MVGKEINLLKDYPKTKRDINKRLEEKTEEHRAIARKFGKDFFDGDRKFGYGGFNYDPKYWNKTVKNFQGNTDTPALEKILLKSTTDNSESEIKASGAFIAIGHDPATSLFLNKIKMDKENYIITKPDSTSTSIPGVFAAGDVKDKIYRQAVTAAGMGCIAALEAEKFLAENS